MGGTGSGGARRPSKPAGSSGIGKHSQRTDGGPADKKAMRVSPDLDAPGQQFGDRAAAEAAQAAIPLKRSSSPRPQPQEGGRLRRPGGAGETPPDFLFSRPTDRAGEATTAGLDVGPGEGSEVLQNQPIPPADEMDDRELVLQWLVDAYGNQDAYGMLNELRQQRVQSEMATYPTITPEYPDPMSDAAEGLPGPSEGFVPEDDPNMVEEDPAEFSDFMGESAIPDEEAEAAAVAAEEAPAESEAVAE